MPWSCTWTWHTTRSWTTTNWSSTNHITEAKLVADEQDEKDMIALRCACISMRQGEYDKAASALMIFQIKKSRNIIAESWQSIRMTLTRPYACFRTTRTSTTPLPFLTKPGERCPESIARSGSKRCLRSLHNQCESLRTYQWKRKTREFKAKAFQLDPSPKVFRQLDPIAWNWWKPPPGRGLNRLTPKIYTCPTHSDRKDKEGYW